MTNIKFLFCPQDLLMALCEEFEEECWVSLAQTIEQRVRTAVKSLYLVPVLSAGLVDGAVRGV
jgi:hypothetical protein